MIVEHINTWIGDGVIVELFKGEEQFIILVYGADGCQTAEIRVDDGETVTAVISAILIGEGLEEWGL